MNRLTLAAAAMFLLVPLSLRAKGPASAPSTLPAVIKVADKAAIEAAHGQSIVIEGKIASASWSSSGKVLNIEFEGAGDKGFMAAAFSKNKAKLDEAFGGDFAKSLQGATVRLKGKLGKFKDRPQVVIDSASQVTILPKE